MQCRHWLKRNAGVFLAKSIQTRLWRSATRITVQSYHEFWTRFINGRQNIDAALCNFPPFSCSIVSTLEPFFFNRCRRLPDDVEFDEVAQFCRQLCSSWNFNGQHHKVVRCVAAGVMNHNKHLWSRCECKVSPEAGAIKLFHLNILIFICLVLSRLKWRGFKRLTWITYLIDRVYNMLQVKTQLHRNRTHLAHLMSEWKQPNATSDAILPEMQ